MQAVDTQVDGRALTRLDNLVVQLLLDLGNHLLDAGGVYAAIAHQLVESQTAGLAAHGVEAADDDSLGRVVDNNLDAAGSLQSTDITTLATDDASLDVVVVDVEHRDAVLDGRLRSHALDGLYHDFLGLGIGVQLGLIHDFIDIAGSGGLGFVLQRLHQTVASLLGTQSREFFQLLTLLQLHLLQFVLLHGQQFLLVVEALLLVVEVVLAATELFLALVQRYLALLQLVLALLDVLVALLHLLLQLCLLVQEFLLHLQQFLFLHHFGLLIGGVNHLVVFSFQYEPENQVSANAAYNQGGNGNNDVNHK